MGSTPGQFAQRDVDAVVVGGGFAGVIAARDLSHAGYSVILLEARQRLGGRTHYRPFRDTDQMVEMGGTWLTAETEALRHVWDETRRYDIPIAESPSPQFATHLIGGVRRNGVIPVPEEELLGFERGLIAVHQASRRIEALYPLGSQCLDLDIPSSDWLATLDLPSSTAEYFDLFVELYFGCPSSDVSALHLLGQTAAMGYSGIALFMGLGAKFAHGTKSLIDAIVADSEVEIRLETPVAAIEQDRSGVSVTTTASGESAGETIRCASCVVAVPLNCWGDIDFGPRLGYAKEVVGNQRQAGRALKVWALVTNLPNDYFLGFGAAKGLRWISTEYMVDGNSLMCGFAPITSPRSIDTTDVASVQRAIREFAPEADVLAVDSHDWNEDPFANGAYTAIRPGWFKHYAYEMRMPEGRLAFATSDIAEGTGLGLIAGAIQSGAAAAAQVDAIIRHGVSPHAKGSA